VHRGKHSLIHKRGLLFGVCLAFVWRLFGVLTLLVYDLIDLLLATVVMLSLQGVLTLLVYDLIDLHLATVVMLSLRVILTR
jgi:hypothetical protein